MDPKIAEYLSGLPEVDTARLPQGALFWAAGRIYQVVEASAGGYHKAREWRKTEATDVALIPGSLPSRFLPLVTRGCLLPVYRTRLELTANDQPSCFVFPTEPLALDAAYFDVDLIQSRGAYVRNHGEEPAFAVTDGVHYFRLYYYRLSASGRRTNLSSLEARPLPFVPRPHTDGPGYWRLLSSWLDALPGIDTTLQLRRVDPEQFRPDDPLPNAPAR